MQPLPQPAPQPAVAERAGPAQLHLIELHRDRIQLTGWNRTIVRKQTQLAVAALVFVKNFQRSPPRLLLGVIDLTEIEHLSLRGATPADAAIFDHGEIPMCFAILVAFVLPQKHAPRYRRSAARSSRG